MQVALHLQVPDSDIESYVVHKHIDDENEDDQPRFTIIFSTKKNIEKMKSKNMVQTDATYRLNWLNFPVSVVGKINASLIWMIRCH